MTAPTPGQAAAHAFVTGCVARGLTASQASVPPEGQLSTVRGLWADIAQAAIDAATEGTIRALGFTLADIGRFIEAQGNAQQPQPAPELAELRELTANHEQLLATGMKPDAIRYHAEVAADRALLRGEVETLRELLDEIGVMAANAPEEGDSFGVLEQIAMRRAAAGVPEEGSR